jgi:hypothetical protein
MDTSSAERRQKFNSLETVFNALIATQQDLLKLMGNVCIIHFYYMEVFKRLIVAKADMRTIRKYLIDYFGIFRSVSLEIQVIRNGKLDRAYDVTNTPTEFIHPDIYGSFNPQSRVVGDTTRLSLRSISGFNFMKDNLLPSLNLQNPMLHLQIQCVRDVVKDFDDKICSMKSCFYNWEMDLVAMFDNVQQILQTKLCYGYKNTVGGYTYDLSWEPKQPVIYRKYPNMNIPFETIAFNMENNAALIKYNINNCVIPDAFGVFFAARVTNSVAVRLAVLTKSSGRMERCVVRSFARCQEKIKDRAKISDKVWHDMYITAIDKEIAKKPSEDTDYWF